MSRCFRAPSSRLQKSSPHSPRRPRAVLPPTTRDLPRVRLLPPLSSVKSGAFVHQTQQNILARAVAHSLSVRDVRFAGSSSSNSETDKSRQPYPTPVSTASLLNVPANPRCWKMLVACLGSMSLGHMRIVGPSRGEVGGVPSPATHLKEGHDGLLGLRRAARATRLRGTLLQSLTENLVSAMACAAHQIGCEIRWRQRHRRRAQQHGP